MQTLVVGHLNADFDSLASCVLGRLLHGPKFCADAPGALFFHRFEIFIQSCTAELAVDFVLISLLTARWRRAHTDPVSRLAGPVGEGLGQQERGVSGVAQLHRHAGMSARRTGCRGGGSKCQGLPQRGWRGTTGAALGDRRWPAPLALHPRRTTPGAAWCVFPSQSVSWA